MFFILFLFISICIVRFFYFLLYKNIAIVAAIRNTFSKQLIIITFLSIIALFAYSKIARYDTMVNSKKKCEETIKQIEEDDYIKMYASLSKDLKNKYSLSTFCTLFIEFNNQNNCINFECINVSSNDKSGLTLSNCNNSSNFLDITFKGGWGFGWKISNIQSITLN